MDFFIENFATASSRYTGDIHNTSVVGLFMTQVLASPVHHGVKKDFTAALTGTGNRPEEVIK